MGGKRHALFPDFAQAGQGKHLEPSAVGQNRPLPTCKGMKPSEFPHQFVPRPDVQMIGVAELHLAFQVLQIVRGYRALDGAAGRDIHERRGFNRPVRRLKPPAAGRPYLCEYLHKALLKSVPLSKAVSV